MIAWGLGLFMVVILCKVFRIKAQGLAAFLLLVPVAYSVGKFILLVFGVDQ